MTPSLMDTSNKSEHDLLITYRPVLNQILIALSVLSLETSHMSHIKFDPTPLFQTGNANGLYTRACVF